MRRATQLASIITASLVVGVAAGAATTARFADVPDDHWASDAIEWVTDAGIMRGRGENGDLFEPDKPVSRAKLAQILHRLDRHYESQVLTIAQEADIDEIVWVEVDGEWYGTSNGFDTSYSWYEVIRLVRDLCTTMGSTPANMALSEVPNVIGDWIEGTEWKRAATDDDKWRVVFYGYWALCPEYASVYDAWSDADWPPLDFD